jgi:hypothetical protein
MFTAPRLLGMKVSSTVAAIVAQSPHDGRDQGLAVRVDGL